MRNRQGNDQNNVRPSKVAGHNEQQQCRFIRVDNRRHG